jgi:hypothetical protein
MFQALLFHSWDLDNISVLNDLLDSEKGGRVNHAATHLDQVKAALRSGHSVNDEPSGGTPFMFRQT